MGLDFFRLCHVNYPKEESLFALLIHIPLGLYHRPLARVENILAVITFSNSRCLILIYLTIL